MNKNKTIIEILIKDETGKLIDHSEWKGNIFTHQGEVEMILGSMMRMAVKKLEIKTSRLNIE